MLYFCKDFTDLVENVLVTGSSLTAWKNYEVAWQLSVPPVFQDSFPNTS